MDFSELVENEINKKRMLNEATETELSKEIIELYGNLFDALSDTARDCASKATLDGNGKVSEDLRTAEVTIQKIKKILKTVSGSKTKEKLGSDVKKIFGEIANSLEKVRDRFQNELLPKFEIDTTEHEFNPSEEIPTEDQE